MSAAAGQVLTSPGEKNDLEAAAEASEKEPAIKGNGQPVAAPNPAAPKQAVAANLKAMSLVLVTLQTTGMVILTRFSRVGERQQYIVCTMIIMSELVKLFFSTALLAVEQQSLPRAIQVIYREFTHHRTECLKLLVPAGLYFIQNNVLIYALTNLDAAVYQICYQSKLLVTAFLSVLILGKSLSATHWGALFLLFVGVVVVNMSSSKEKTQAPGQEPMLGMIAVVSACFTSGMAGVYFEKLVKGGTQSVWLRNFFLALFSLGFGLLTTVTKNRAEIAEKGFFYGYDWVVCLVILVNAVGGMVVAMVIKYADNILKGFATGISTVLSTVCAIYLFGFEPTASFAVGASLVVVSTFIYGNTAWFNGLLGI